MAPFVFGIDFYPSMSLEAIQTFSIFDRMAVTDRIKTTKSEEALFEHLIKGLEDHATDKEWDFDYAATQFIEMLVEPKAAGGGGGYFYDDGYDYG